MGLSELFIIQLHIEAGERGMTVMYVLPKYELRNRFVDNRIFKIQKKVQKYNYMLKQAETSVQRKSLIHFGNGTIAFVGSNVESEFIEIPVDSARICMNGVGMFPGRNFNEWNTDIPSALRAC